jgi:hypothetical protein
MKLQFGRLAEIKSLGITMLPDRWRAVAIANGKYIEE